MNSLRTISLLSLALSLFLGACAQPGTQLDEAFGETGVQGPFDAVPDGDDKYDGHSARGPRVAAGAATEVWSVDRAWADVDSAAGMSWDANSGLDWEQKFDAWVSSFELEARHGGSGETFVMPTPYGDRSLHAPTLECAEVAIFLRVTFASWYHLPFYMQGWDSASRQALFAGHFGFINREGARVGNFPKYRTTFPDHEGSWEPGQAWPSDSRLRRRRLGDDDIMDFLGEGAQAGAYFDEIFLNKRVGYFMRLILLYYGSTNLADGANTFQIVPETIEGGDMLVKRYRRRGIGHVKPVFRVERLSEDALQVSIASGSMPRREPVWEHPNTARSSFLANAGGGPGDNSDGDSYASLGGGVRRWRTAVLRSGRWYAAVHAGDRDAYIADSDHEAVAARPARFDEILRTLSPNEQRDAALGQVEAAREHLRSYPASCSARTNREHAFEALYSVMDAEFGWTGAQVDAEYRTLEDYVFAELEYDVSRTCCWNRSNAAMHDIIMNYADAEQADADVAAVCEMPTVFRAETDGYARWNNHAASIGRGGEWRAWSEDESCSQRNVPEDTVATGRDIAGFCSTTDVPAPPTVATCEPDGGDDNAASATPLIGEISSAICSGDSGDWYRIDDDATVSLTFSHSDGDLDMEAYNEAGEVIGTSAGTTDSETITASGPFYVRVFGYSGAQNEYWIHIVE
ncbi:MAG: hypothetical protein DRJ42_15640 [Deltaproteobacteria bacterium]|nr:MAG: hypothetical protein DRJ42_15640 [Deltaproteobacteria bacterium]